MKRDTRDAVISDAEISKLRTLENLVRETLGARTAISIASVRLPETTGEAAIPEAMMGSATIQRFISRDLRFLTVTAPVPISANSTVLNAQIADLRTAIASQLAETEIEITGSSQMKSSVGPRLISELRFGLLLSVVISVLVIGLSFRSWKVGLACLVPNILPILVIEAFIWFSAGRMDMSLTIALMIGFGLAIDDTIHFLNHYAGSGEVRPGETERCVHTLDSVGPALTATTIIIGLGLCTTVLATLPSIYIFALAVAGVLVFALAADMWVLPSVLSVIESSAKRISLSNHRTGIS